ncbi:MAG: DNA primase catalytic subunit PriS, partial [Candidatus Methanoperedens sp.]|nr:DNA primase catalytic subunit PriS [Candidatus Methanoperedens sp.]
MNFRTKQYLRKRFGDYYKTSELTLPPELTRREWGFIFFDDLPEVVMRRHNAFSSQNEALDYLKGMTPAHVYHSAAYYQFPGAATMKEKQWQGADLIFDLDADHLPPDVRGKSYKEMLDAVKAETVKLLDFLLEDFGFSEDNVSIVFSGGRGYHIHVRDPKVFSLESAERREIVDYVSGIGFDYDSVLYKRKTKWKVYDGIKHHPMAHETMYEMAEMSTWGKRVAKETIKFLDKIRLLEFEQGFEELKKIEGITTSNAKKLIKKLQSFGSSDELSQTISEEGLDTKSMQPVRLYIIKNMGAHVEGKTDEPVTADVKRLIRMPSSLHGGSGMRVVP